MSSEIELKYRDAINKANAAKNDAEFSEAVASLIEISDVYPKAAYEVYLVLKRCGYTEYAYFYLQLSAVQDYEIARIILGKCLAEGIYFEKNEKKAIEILSAYPDNASALCGLGFIYTIGEQVPKDQQKAVQLFAKSARMGYAQSSYNIALICAGDTGLKRNEKQMFDWLNTAIAQGSGDACFYAAREYCMLGKNSIALNCLYQGIKLGHKGCIEAYPILKQQSVESRPVYQSGIYQSEENEAEFSYTGQAEIVQQAEIAQAEAMRRRSKAMDASAAYSGGGFVDYETGFTVDRNGNTIVTDESGFSYSEEKGTMFYDEDSQFLFSNQGTAYFDENMQSMYDMQKEKWSMIFKF